MSWELIVIVVMAMVIVLVPVAFIWYLNIAGFYANNREARQRRAAVRLLVRETIQIIRSRQAVNRSILEAIEAGENKRADVTGGQPKWESEEAVATERAMPAAAMAGALSRLSIT